MGNILSIVQRQFQSSHDSSSNGTFHFWVSLVHAWGIESFNLQEFFLLLNTEKDILKNVGNQTVDGSHWIPYRKKKIPLKSMASVNCLVTNNLQNIFYCVQQKKETHTGLEQHEG